MKISIITTCLNRVSTVSRSIRSVMEQSYPDVEHIVVDGASKDGTLEAIKACRSDRISVLISERDRGFYEAINKGLRLATGDIVGWLHSDDIFFGNDVLSHVAAVFERTGCDMVYGNGQFVSAKNPEWVIRDWISGTYSDDKIRHGWLPLHTTVFVRKDIIERFGYYMEHYRVSSDTEWLIRIMYQTGLKIEYLDEYFVKMDYGGLSTSFSKTVLHWREDLGIYYQHQISPRTALLQKVLRKIPQFFMAPFKTQSTSHNQ